MCKSCSLKTIAYNRYAEANIPVDYWDLNMDQFKGDKVLFDKYTAITSDLNKYYTIGTSLCFAGPHGLRKNICIG